MSETTTLRRTRQLKGQLTDLKLRNLETREKPYKVADGNGLYVLVSATGLRAWRWKYRFARKEKVLPLGKYPDVTLAEARAARDEARKKLLADIDPAEERRDAKVALLVAHENSFETVARAWHEVWAPTKHQRYSEDVLVRLERNVFPVLGHKPVSQIEPKDVVRVMDLVQGRGATDIARRVRNTCSQIFRYAVTKGLCSRNPAADFKPSDVLPQRKAENHARIDEADLPELLRKIEAYEGSQLTRLAMKLLALTFVRTSELIEARWNEIDFDNAEWRIPAERMKMKRPHIVPLAPKAIEVLRTLQLISGRFELLFPGERDRKKPMSNNTILKALERMGYKGRMTGHGFRGLASTALYERQFPSDHIELQLAHVRGKVRGAYDHSRQLPQRRKMMEFWADYLDSCLSARSTAQQTAPAESTTQECEYV
ncbi:MAG TPA: tyrosine-type recombinase/integrase [Ramlibacter sp.]|uniref:tyrosine-type recombinase/integrase n=1 Tax=Ramlibacter sp. TaxID=1917967 RepID=UPI002BA4FF83|nr:tyrosine-type recombinase/integrase [Ramlibacter sp.]HVZ45484.1 tyrosine-type recombinase/integrase [Ramlibacter sp.]